MSKLTDWATQRGLAGLLWWHSRPIWVERALSGREYAMAHPPVDGRLIVGLVQMRLELAQSAGEFVEQIYPCLREAVDGGAQMVVFPEYTGASLLGILPGVAKIASTTTLEGAVEELAGGKSIGIGDVFRAIAPAARAIYVRTFVDLARRFNVYIIGGSLIVPGPAGELYNTAHLFAPSGHLIGTQRKLHLYSTEDGWLTRGKQLSIFSLPFGRLAMPICMDYTYWETSRIASLRGAEILVDISADEAGDNAWMRARGVRQRVQESLTYGLHCFMIADIFGLHWRGQSAIFAPLELLPPGQHALAEARTVDRPEVVVATLDLGALRVLRVQKPLEFNRELYRHYLPGLYESATCASQATAVDRSREVNQAESGNSSMGAVR